MSDHFGLPFKNPLQVDDAGRKGLSGLQVLEVTDMLTQKCPVAAAQAEGALQFRPQGQDPGLCPGQGQTVGDKTAGAAQQQRFSGHHAGDGVIATDVNGAVVTELVIGDGGEAFTGIDVLKSDGLVAAVAAGHDQGRKLAQQQVVERGCRQHDAKIAVARGDQLGQAVAGQFFQQDDGALGAGQQLGFRRADPGVAANPLQIEAHQGERFFIPGFAPPQLGNRRSIVGGYGEMISAQPFNGDNMACGEQGAGLRNRVAVDRVAGGIDQL